MIVFEKFLTQILKDFRSEAFLRHLKNGVFSFIVLLHLMTKALKIVTELFVHVEIHQVRILVLYGPGW